MATCPGSGLVTSRTSAPELSSATSPAPLYTFTAMYTGTVLGLSSASNRCRREAGTWCGSALAISRRLCVAAARARATTAPCWAAKASAIKAPFSRAWELSSAGSCSHEIKSHDPTSVPAHQVTLKRPLCGSLTPENSTETLRKLGTTADSPRVACCAQ